MTQKVADVRANLNENIVNAAKIIGRSKARRAVFEEMYRGKKKLKRVDELMQSTGLGRVHVLNEGKKLAGNGIGAQVKVDGRTAYEKDEFFVHHNDNLVGEEKSSSEGATGRERAAPGAPPCSEK